MAVERWQEGVNILAGAWLFLSPWILDLSGSPAWIAWVLGAIIVAVAVWAMITKEARTAEWIGALLGTGLFVSPWLWGYVGIARTNAWIIGAVVIVASLWAVMNEGAIRHRHQAA